MPLCGMVPALNDMIVLQKIDGCSEHSGKHICPVCISDYVSEYKPQPVPDLWSPKILPLLEGPFLFHCDIYPTFDFNFFSSAKLKPNMSQDELTLL